MNMFFTIFTFCLKMDFPYLLYAPTWGFPSFLYQSKHVYALAPWLSAIRKNRGGFVFFALVWH